MTIAACATGGLGAFLPGPEYRYLEPWLEEVLAQRRASGRLGNAIAGVKGSNFDIRIQRGAGASISAARKAH